jgi:hypothetical protein
VHTDAGVLSVALPCRGGWGRGTRPQRGDEVSEVGLLGALGRAVQQRICREG